MTGYSNATLAGQDAVAELFVEYPQTAASCGQALVPSSFFDGVKMGVHEKA